MKWWMKLQNWVGLRQWNVYSSIDFLSFFIEGEEIYKISALRCSKTGKFYSKIYPFELLSVMDIEHLQRLAGLDEDEYQRLMTSPFVDECIHLIIKGLKKISGL